MTILPPNGLKIIWIALLVLLSAFILAIFIPWLPVGGPFGYLAAKRDVAQGHLRLKLPIGNFGWEALARQTIKEKYNIEIDCRGGSCSPLGLPYTYDRAYNKVQQNAIVKQFGHDVVAATMRQTREDLTKKFPDPETVTAGLKIELQLIRFNAGDPASSLEEALSLSTHPSAYTPNLPVGEEHIIYFVPEGNIHVLTNFTPDSPAVLSSTPFFIPDSTPVTERVAQSDRAWDEYLDKRKRSIKSQP